LVVVLAPSAVEAQNRIGGLSRPAPGPEPTTSIGFWARGKAGQTRFSSSWWKNDKGIQDFDEAIRLCPTDAVLYYERGRSYYALGDYERAIKDYDEAIRLTPGASYAFVARGEVKVDQKEWDLAMKDFSEAIRFDPKNVSARRSRARAWSSRGDDDKAIADYEEIVAIDPTDHIAWWSLGSLWYRKKAYDEAIKNYNAVIRLKPNFQAAYIDRGDAWRCKKEYGKALGDYDEAIWLEPRLTGAERAKAWLLATCPVERYRDGREALELAKRACDRRGWKGAKDFSALAVLAAAYAEVGDFDQAVRYQKEALDDKEYAKEHGEEARKRLKLYEEKKPFRDSEE
jgi:tetratricopeptide (TPR) repeat protein